MVGRSFHSLPSPAVGLISCNLFPVCFLNGGRGCGFQKCGLHVAVLAGQFSDPLKLTTEVSVVIRVIGKEHVYAADNQTQSLAHAKHTLHH